jgi:hypothetical protein
MNKKSGNALQHFGALLARAVGDDVFELGDERGGGTHRQFTTLLATGLW